MPPEIHATVNPPAGLFAPGATVRVDFICTDTASGIRSCPLTATLDTTSRGLHTASFQAIDEAGNVASVVVHYAVQASGVAPMIAFPDPRGVLGSDGAGPAPHGAGLDREPEASSASWGRFPAVGGRLPVA